MGYKLRPSVALRPGVCAGTGTKTLGSGDTGAGKSELRVTEPLPGLLSYFLKTFLGTHHFPICVPTIVDTLPGQKPPFLRSQLYPPKLTQCLACSKCPINVYRLNK